jgi:hypothetical protein
MSSEISSAQSALALGRLEPPKILRKQPLAVVHGGRLN